MKVISEFIVIILMFCWVKLDLILVVSEQLLLDENSLQDNGPLDNCPLDGYPLDYCSPDNCPGGKMAPRQLSTPQREIVHPPGWLFLDHCSLKVIASWQYAPGNCPQWKVAFGWFVACIITAQTNGPEENCFPEK